MFIIGIMRYYYINVYMLIYVYAYLCIMNFHIFPWSTWFPRKIHIYIYDITMINIWEHLRLPLVYHYVTMVRGLVFVDMTWCHSAPTLRGSSWTRTSNSPRVPPWRAPSSSPGTCSSPEAARAAAGRAFGDGTCWEIAGKGQGRCGKSRENQWENPWKSTSTMNYRVD